MTSNLDQCSLFSLFQKQGSKYQKIERTTTMYVVIHLENGMCYILSLSSVSVSILAETISASAIDAVLDTSDLDAYPSL